MDRKCPRGMGEGEQGNRRRSTGQGEVASAAKRGIMRSVMLSLEEVVLAAVHTGLLLAVLLGETLA